MCLLFGNSIQPKPAWKTQRHWQNASGTLLVTSSNRPAIGTRRQAKAKPYQVKQVRAVIHTYSLAGDDNDNE
ncbi:MAG: hypothetical protein R3C18_23010 [Planctomycetaceae bacterium]